MSGDHSQSNTRRGLYEKAIGLFIWLVFAAIGFGALYEMSILVTKRFRKVAVDNRSSKQPAVDWGLNQPAAWPFPPALVDSEAKEQAIAACAA